jgi:subfamily B ATP-binding cassette protein MsbA
MRRLIRLLWYGRAYWLQWFASVVLMAGVGLLDGFRFLLMQPIVDRVLNPATGSDDILLINKFGIKLYLQQLVPSHFHNVWTIVTFALISSALLKGILDYLGTYLVNYAGFGLVTDLRNDLYSSVLRRSSEFFQRNPTGSIISAIINDVDKVQFAMSNILSEFLQQFFTLLAVTFVVIATGGKLAWVLLCFVPFVFYSARRIGKKVRTTTRSGQDKLAEIQNLLQDTITGNRIVKAFSTELWELVRFRSAAMRLFRANLRSIRAQAVSSPLMDFLGAIAISLLLLLGRDQVKAGHMTPGQFFAFIVAVFSLYNPVRKFAVFNNSFQQALGASESVFKFFDAKDVVGDKPKAVAMPPFHNSVKFEGVRFCYSDSEENREVICGVDLDVKRGEVVALVGGSGAGKSTLVHLIPRFFDVTGGRILIDGHDVRDVTLASLRSQIGIVTQETILFNDSVRNNIAYGQPNIPLDDVEAAARAALAHDFIMAMPDGYSTIIGEKGFRLSGGERQRLSIARAILKNAPILILDEATSALDSESEQLVSEALQNLMSGRTSFVIAHRLSTVRRANRIVVLENGTVADMGTHEELLGRLGTYRRLYQLQFADSDAIRNGDLNAMVATLPIASNDKDTE